MASRASTCCRSKTIDLQSYDTSDQTQWPAAAVAGHTETKMSSRWAVIDRARAQSPEGMIETHCLIITCFVLQRGVTSASSDIMSHDRSYNMWKSTKRFCSQVIQDTAPLSCVCVCVLIQIIRCNVACYKVVTQLEKVITTHILHYCRHFNILFSYLWESDWKLSITVEIMFLIVYFMLLLNSLE